MRQTDVLQEIRKMKFNEAYAGWQASRLTQEEAARLLDGPFVATSYRYEEAGLEGLADQRISQVLHRRAPTDEVLNLVERYRIRHAGWNVKHFHAW